MVERMASGQICGRKNGVGIDLLLKEWRRDKFVVQRVASGHNYPSNSSSPSHYNSMIAPFSCAPRRYIMLAVYSVFNATPLILKVAICFFENNIMFFERAVV